MRHYDTPGIYPERADSSGGGIAVLRTDVTGMAGIAERGPLHQPVPVDSMRQFEAWFGRPIDAGYLAYAARGFFENGGRRLWVVRIAAPAAAAASATVIAGGLPAWRIAAASPGVWGNRISVKLVERRRVQRRGWADPLETDRVTLDNLAGLGPLSLVEVRGEAGRTRAVVRAVDALEGALWLDRSLAVGPPGGGVRLDAVSYGLAVSEGGRPVAQIDNLSAVPGHPRYGPELLRMPWTSVDPLRPDAVVPEPDPAVLRYFRSGRGADLPPPVVIRELRDSTARAALAPFDEIRSGEIGPLQRIAAARDLSLSGGADGLAALRLDDFIGRGVAPDAAPLVIAAGRRGIAALDLVDEIGLVALPDAHIRPRAAHPLRPPEPCLPDPCLPATIPPPADPVPPAVGEMPPVLSLDAIGTIQDALVLQCERRRDRVALLDAPLEAAMQESFTASELRHWRTRFDTAFAALYAPWIRVVDPLRDGPGLTRAIPPSGHVAGQAAALDLLDGVHRAPANRPLAWVQAATLPVSAALHGHLNSLGVNVIRAEPGRGLRVLGARTMSSDPDWRYLNVRRLMSMIAKAIDLSIQWAVFEPNDWRTRAKLTLAVQSFLLALWSRGGLAGASPEAAFRIRCDETNNPPELRDRGQLLIEVGVAPAIPFEFIVLRIGREANGFRLEPDAAA